MERRGRIPVAKFRTQEGKTRSRSRVREPDYNEQDPETDLFTLLEDNIALKEENKALKLDIEDVKKQQSDFLAEKKQVGDELQVLKQQNVNLGAQFGDITAKLTKVQSERNALDKLHKIKLEKINSLEQELRQLQSEQQQQIVVPPAVLDAPGSLKGKLLKVLPSLSGGNEMESLIEVESSATATPITSELVERLVDEFLALKSSFNAVELQLYEANEKIAELIENQHHLEEENETLRSENTNLTKVAKLLTENMKESVETSKKMETALIKLKQRNDELNAKARDVTDAGGQSVAETPSPSTLKANQEFEHFTEEVHNQNRDHGERIVEMKTLMEAAIQKNTNDELKTLQLRLEILEEELRKANARAELAEGELEKYKCEAEVRVIAPAAPLAPPPPPPPMPATLLYKPPGHVSNAGNPPGEGDASFSDSIALHNLQKGASGNSDKIIENVMHQVQPEAATGLDALVREFKSGRVTLRRNRRKTRTNEALQEMFQVLEVSQKQNRDSKICINMHI